VVQPEGVQSGFYTLVTQLAPADGPARRGTKWILHFGDIHWPGSVVGAGGPKVLGLDPGTYNLGQEAKLLAPRIEQSRLMGTSLPSLARFRPIRPRISPILACNRRG